jgi:hypothetical protein
VLWRDFDKLGVAFIEHFANADEPNIDRLRRAPARRACA